ncbi:double zinc ribbon domain-containing protein [Oryzisolibacter propanilivorax]|uniref:double zinc ribbon domain-containing protein n=1 Tax=Oryzisolibacter propanilivorax TaxID=1527607 RepID=UPI000B80F60E|nr:zinc ribbon domain-containing protein [Oryzisolibacter propanilivorax]
MGILDRLLGGHHGGGHHGRTEHHGGRVSATPDAQGVPCAHCKAWNAIEARFCQQCGKPMAPSACARCGSALQGDAKFCPQCGTGVA